MRYLAMHNTRLPDGRIILAGGVYDYPLDPEQAASPETIHEIAQHRLREDLAMEAKQRGEVSTPAPEPEVAKDEVPVERKLRGWPKGKPRKPATV